MSRGGRSADDAPCVCIPIAALQRCAHRRRDSGNVALPLLPAAPPLRVHAKLSTWKMGERQRRTDGEPWAMLRPNVPLTLMSYVHYPQRSNLLRLLRTAPSIQSSKQCSKGGRGRFRADLDIQRQSRHDMEEEEDVAELATTATTPKQPVFPVWEKALRVFVGRRSTLTALGAYLVALALPILLTGIAFQYDVHLDTGITSFRARDEPTAQKQVLLTGESPTAVHTPVHAKPKAGPSSQSP
jgi:hypothetical protein